jgi:hypothetical protein
MKAPLYDIQRAEEKFSEVKVSRPKGWYEGISKASPSAETVEETMVTTAYSMTLEQG